MFYREENQETSDHSIGFYLGLNQIYLIPIVIAIYL
jgi:hypothetical protein